MALWVTLAFLAFTDLVHSDAWWLVFFITGAMDFSHDQLVRRYLARNRQASVVQ